MTPATSPVRIEMPNGVPIYFEVHGSGYPLLLLLGVFRLRPGPVRVQSFAPQGVGLAARKAHSQEVAVIPRLSKLGFGIVKKKRPSI